MTGRLVGPAALLVAITWAAYGNALGAVFQFDDYNVIVDNALVHDWSAWWAGIRGIRPLLKASYTLNWTSGLGAAGFHAVNVLIHALNVVLVFLLLERLASARGQREAASLAFIAALCFALHPVHTEAVTYVSGRSMSLMACFYLASLLAYSAGGEAGRPLLRYALSPLLFALALGVKETAVTLPLALLLWDASAWRRPSAWWRRQGLHWALLAAVLLLLLMHPGYARFFQASWQIRAGWDNLVAQIAGLGYLLGRFVLIFDMNIDPDLFAPAAWTPQLAIGGIAILAGLGLGLRLLGRGHWAGFGLLWLFLHLAPTNSLMPRYDLANERHLYLAGIGIYWLLAQALGAALPTQRRRLVAVALLALLLGLATVSRNRDYASEVALWSDTVAKSPQNARAYNNLGYAQQLAGRLDAARRAYERALELDPGHPRARRNLEAIAGG